MQIQSTFLVSFSEMGLNPFLVILMALFGGFFLFSFVFSSRNMDAKGVLDWMLKKPDDWIGKEK